MNLSTLVHRMNLNHRICSSITNTLKKTNVVSFRRFTTESTTPTVNETPKKDSFFARQNKKLANTILNNQGNLKFYAVYGVLGFLGVEMIRLTNSGIHLLQDLNYSDAVIANATYGAGIMHTITIIGLVRLATYLTSLAGRPSQGVIHEIMEHARTNPTLMEKLGGQAIPGNFSTVSTLDGHIRFMENKGIIYKEWLNFVLNKTVGPVHALPFPQHLESIIRWMKGEKEYDIQESENKNKRTLDEKTVKFIEKNDVLIRQQKLKNDYSGWERIWAPRRLQMVMQVTSPDKTQSGMIIAEVEKSQTGLGSTGSGGFTRYKTFQYIDLSTGEIIQLEGAERPVLVGNAQLTKLFETIPIQEATQQANFTEGVTVTKLENPVVPPENIAPKSTN